MNYIGKFVSPLVLFVVATSLWQWAHAFFGINSIILPAPSEIGAAFLSEYQMLLAETGYTMLESVSGFLLGSSAAFILAVIFTHSRIIRDALYPYAVALKSTPLIALAPLLVLWFGNGIESKIVMSALVAFFPVLVNSVNGLEAIDKEALELMQSLSASRLQVLYKIRIPCAAPFVFPALKIASSLAVVGAVIGEFTGATRGVGFVINNASYYLETPTMFAAIIMISFGGIIFFSFVSFLEARIVFWTDTARAV